MRPTMFIILAGLGLCVVTGMLVPVTGVKPMTPSAELPTFEQVARDLPNRNVIIEAVEMGRVEQHPQRRRLRERLRAASERLKLDPCSAELRREVAAAALPFLELERGMRQFPDETVDIDGRAHSVSDIFDMPAHSAIQDAVLEGRLSPNDLPDGMFPFPADCSDRLAGTSCTS